MHIFLFYILMPILALVYTGIGFFMAERGFDKAKNIPESVAGYGEKDLIKDWENYNRYPTRYSKPDLELSEFYFVLGSGNNGSYKNAAKAQAYRRAFRSPAWPLLVAGDVYRGYQKAKAGERVYLLEQSTKALEDAMKNKPELDKVYEKAQAALKKAEAAA